MGYGAIELQTSWHIFCLNFYWNESKPSFGMCPFLRNFARLPHINFIYLDTWRYAEAYCVKKTQLFDKSTKARTSLISANIVTKIPLKSNYSTHPRNVKNPCIMKFLTKEPSINCTYFLNIVTMNKTYCSLF